MKKFINIGGLITRLQIAAGVRQYYSAEDLKNDFNIKVDGVNHEVTLEGNLLTIKGPNAKELGDLLKLSLDHEESLTKQVYKIRDLKYSISW